MRRIISYIFPLTRKIKSEHNGCLELTISNGRTLLNTENSNYSYGSLQRILKFALLKVDLSTTKDILVLGLGGGCVIESLRNEFNYNNRITCIDIDPVIIEIAKNEFGISEDNKTYIICKDAYDYILQDGINFDLIIVDLFIDNIVPKKIITKEFWQGVINRLKIGGVIIFNSMCIPHSDFQNIETELMKRGFKYNIYQVEKTNRILIANYC